MSRTEIKSIQIKDQEVKRSDLNDTVSGEAVVKRLIAGDGITLSSTGIDTGTGDVTITASSSSSITSLNTLTASTQTFSTGTSGTDFNISSSTSTHTFNIPDASSSNRGLITTGTQTIAGTKTFSSTISGSIDGNSATSTKLATARDISVTGDATWSVSFDGSANASGSLTLANSGATAGTYRSVTVDAKGRVTAGTNPTTFSGYGISDTSANLASAITDETGSGSLVFANSPTLVTPILGTPTSGTLTNCTGYTFANISSKPTTLSGYGITDAIASSEKGAANGVATLNASGLVTSSQLPSFQAKSTMLGVIYDQFVPQATASWTSVEYAPSLDLWCAVGASGTSRVLTSSDAKTWTLRTQSQTNSWRGVAWSPSLSLFAAVSSDGTNRVMTSPDGITWTNRTAAAANAWQDVAWSPSLSLFAAVSSTGTGNRVMTSADGITWTSRTSAADSTWRRIKWISELSLFIAVGSGSTTTSIMTSADGTTWTVRTTPSTNYYDLVYFPDLSVLVVSDSADNLSYGGILTSSDGITYSTGSLNMKDSAGRLYGIEYVSSAKCLVFGYYDGVTTLLERAGRAFTTTGGNSHRLGKAINLLRLKYAATPDVVVGITSTSSLFVSGLG